MDMQIGIKLSNIDKEKVLLVGVNINNQADFEISMEELDALAKACEMDVVGNVVQNLAVMNNAFYIGTGKVNQVRELAMELNADLILFDQTLSPSQIRNLQKEIQMPIMDRTGIILEIFARRAKTKEARIQVELAQLQYMLPRLVGLRAALGRQGGKGGLSNKGAGEKKLELDRRALSDRVSDLKRELLEIEKEAITKRKQRSGSSVFQVALVGYTNAGKSTIMNRFVDKYIQDDEKKVFEKDMLFATLDTTIRKIQIKDNQEFLLSDTVGFISNLPHSLIKAFRSTLEEVTYADLLLHVVDFSDPNYKEHMQITEATLKDIGAKDIPVVYVYNKADKTSMQIPKVSLDSIYMSALQSESLDALTKIILSHGLKEYEVVEFLIPYTDGKAVSYIVDHGQVDCLEYQESGTYVKAACKKEDIGRYQKYIIKGE